MIQEILVWVAVAAAVAYLAKVFVLPQLGADKRPDVPVRKLVRRRRSAPSSSERGGGGERTAPPSSSTTTMPSSPC